MSRSYFIQIKKKELRYNKKRKQGREFTVNVNQWHSQILELEEPARVLCYGLLAIPIGKRGKSFLRLCNHSLYNKSFALIPDHTDTSRLRKVKYPPTLKMD